MKIFAFTILFSAFLIFTATPTFAGQNLITNRTGNAITLTDSAQSEINNIEFTGDKTIEQNDTLNADVSLSYGNLTVFGLVKGNVYVYGGNLIVKSTGKIDGNAQVVGGKITKEQGAIITGYEDITDTLDFDFKIPAEQFLHFDYNFDVPWQVEITTIDKFIIRYNRVESIFIGIGRDKKFYWDGDRLWSAYGSIGWGFKSHAWRGNLGLSRQFARVTKKGCSMLEVGIEGYSLTDSKDQWIISTIENTLSSFLMHEDFRDYYEREGATIHISHYINNEDFKSELKLAYVADTYDSLQKNVDWALFGGRKKFRENPAIEAGRMRSLLLFGGLNTITRSRSGIEGWSIFASVEFSKRNWGGEFEFDQYIMDIRRFQPIDKYSNLNARMYIGTGCGKLPRQKIYELGGLGTLNAYPFKYELGNRMILFNMELLLKGQILDDLDFFPLKVFNYANLLLISDAGFVRNVPTSRSALDGFNNIQWKEFKHDFGIALASRNGSARIGICWRTDKSESVKLLLRINRPF